MKKLALLFLLAASCACVHSQVKVTGSASVSGTAAINANSNVTVSSLVVTPANQTVDVGQAVGYTATVTFSDGTILNVTNYGNWSSSNVAVAGTPALTSVESFTCLSAGTATIAVQYGIVFASTTLTCTAVVPPTPTLSAIAVSPATPSVNVGQGFSFTALGTYSDGSQQDLTASSTWSTSDATIASLGTKATTQPISCLKAGSVTITATDPATSVAGNTTLTCIAVLSSIAVTPASPSVLVGALPTFIATCTMSDGSKNDCSLQATWTSSSTTVATVNTPTPADPQGYTAKAAGTTTVKAAIGAVNGTTVLTVTNPGPPPPTLASILVTPATPSVNVGQSINLIATGVYSDSSTAPVTAASTWTTSNAAVATLQLKDCVVGQLCTEAALSGAGATPWNFTTPSAAAPAGADDMIDWMAASLPDRLNFHLGGGATPKYARVDAGVLWLIKSTNGNPSDIRIYDKDFLYQVYTDNNDASQQAACQADGYSSCFSDPKAYKQIVTPRPFTPRYFVPGSTVTILVPPVLTGGGQVNPYVKTTNCGLDNQPIAFLGNVKVVTSGGLAMPAGIATWGGDVGVQPTIETDYYYSGSVLGVYVNRERFYFVKGWGWVSWDHATLQTGVYVVDQGSTNNIKVAGGAPTPNFACKIPNLSTLSLAGTLPPGVTSITSPQMNMPSNTGVIAGTPNLAGTYPFTVQQEDASGVFHLQNQIIRVVATAGQALQTVNCVGAGTATITATDGAISGNTVVTCQNPAPTLTSIAVSPANPTINQGQGLGFLATGTFSDSSKQDVTAIATWTLGTPAVASLGPTNVSPQIVNCVTAGTSTVVATVGAITNSVTLTCSATLSSLAVTPANQTVLTNTNVNYVATGTFSDGSQQNVTSAATWASSNTAVASLGINNGSSQVVRCLTAGAVTITATVGAVTNNTPLTCQIPIPPAPTLVSIAVTPALPSVTVGQSIGFIATGTFSDGTQQNLTSLVGTVWSSGTPANATLGTLTTTQPATCIAAGTSVIQATNSAISGSTTLTCVAPVPTLTSIAVTPASPNQNVGGTVNFIATGTYSDGSSQDITASATWASLTGSVATLGTRTTTQPATCIAAGTSSIRATLSAINGATTLTCTALPPTLTSVVVTPANPTSTVGSAVNFTATCNFSDGSSQNCTTTSAWTSSNTGVSTVSLAGTTEAATCLTVGSATIKAAQGTIFGTTTLTCQTPVPPSQGNDAYCTAGNVPHFGASDSYAALPATCFYTNPAAFTSGGTVRHVSNSVQFASAVAATVCGDIIQIDASFPITEAVLPSLHCAAGTTVRIRGFGFASLPAYGTRVKPCYWGVASLPGYPAFNCASTTVIMPTLTSNPSTGTGAALKIPAGGLSYLIIEGINFTRSAGGLATDTAIDDNGGQWDHLIFQHNGCGGTANDETNRCFVLNRANFAAVIDNFGYEFHCISVSGSCSDAKFIGDGTNTHATDTDNTHKIVNNFMTGGAQCLFSGGGAAAIVPTSLEWRNNYCFRPLTWDPVSPSYNGGAGGGGITNNWIRASTPAGSTNPNFLAFDASNNWYLADKGSGIWKSTNQGSTWAQVNSGLPTLVALTVQVNPVNGDLIATIVNTGAHFYRSTDGGSSWSLIPEGAYHTSAGGSLTGCIVPITSSVRLVCGGFFGSASTSAITSANNGATTSLVSMGTNSSVYSLKYNTVTNDYWMGTENQGIFRSTDGINFAAVSPAPSPSLRVGNIDGITWDSTGNVLFTGQGGVYKCTTSATTHTCPSPVNVKSNPNTSFGVSLYRDSTGALYFSHGPDSLHTESVFRSTDEGLTWLEWDAGLPSGSTVNQFIQNPGSGQIYASLQNGRGIWHSTSGGGGNPFIVKNCFELKNADRVLIEGNYVENGWAGFSQVGNCITLTPKNQNNLAPIATVTNVTARYNWVKSYAQIFQIVNTASDTGGYGTAGNSYSLHDNLGENMQDPTICYQCASSAAQMTLNNATGAPAGFILHSVDINHNTNVIAAGTTKAVYSSYIVGVDAAKTPNNNAPVKWQNNVFARGFFGGLHSSGGGTASCASGQSDAAGIINACWLPNGVATGNAILPQLVTGNLAVPTWPAGNCTTETSFTSLLTNYNNGNGGDYRIKTTSPCHASGNDGKDPGADIPTLLNRIQNVTAF